MKLFSNKDEAWSGSRHDVSIRRQVFLTRGDAPSLTQMGNFILEPGQHVTPHAHPDMWEAFWVLEGVVNFDIDGCSHIFSVGDGILILPDELHALYNNEATPARLLILGLEGDPLANNRSSK